MSLQTAPSSNHDDWRVKLAPGDPVFWQDPDRNLSSGIYAIDSIVGDKVEADDTVLLIKNTAGSHAEVFACELSPATPKTEFFSGYVQFNSGEQFRVDFQARAGASKEAKDSAFVDALAQIARLDYVAIGESSPSDVMGDWAIRMCERAGNRLVEAQEQEVLGRWDWIAGGNASDCSHATEAEAAINAIYGLFPHNDWAAEVANGDTKLGFNEWVEHQIDARNDAS
jgi:hypothetical protein